jgi:hypothetical protein
MFNMAIRVWGMGTGYGAPMLVHSRVYSHNIGNIYKNTPNKV